jgi:hypothetical protein
MLARHDFVIANFYAPSYAGLMDKRTFDIDVALVPHLRRSDAAGLAPAVRARPHARDALLSFAGVGPMCAILVLVPFGKHICTGKRPHCSTCPVLDMFQQVGVNDPR